MGDFQDAIDRVIGGLEKKNKIIYHGHLSEERGISDLVTDMRSVKVNLNNPLVSLVGSF